MEEHVFLEENGLTGKTLCLFFYIPLNAYLCLKLNS